MSANIHIWRTMSAESLATDTGKAQKHDGKKMQFATMLGCHEYLESEALKSVPTVRR